MGHDFTAWVYDLLRPKEAYQERGIHPSGEGFDRYIKFADLTSDDRIFLRCQAQLQWLTLSMVHMLTSFGYTVDTHLFLQRNLVNLFIVGHRFFNHQRRFSGLEIQLIDYPLNWKKSLLSHLRTRSLDTTQRTEHLHQSSRARWIIRANDLPAIVRPMVRLLRRKDQIRWLGGWQCQFG